MAAHHHLAFSFVLLSVAGVLAVPSPGHIYVSSPPPPPPPATACGDYPPALNATGPNVLLIGDSISMPVPPSPGGYGDSSRKILEAKGVTVWHNGGWWTGGQASNTVKGLACTNASADGNWLNVTGTYDVIHFNFGLHDLVAEGPGEGREHVPIPQYGTNLADIYRRLLPHAKHVIWATTTPCPSIKTSMGRTEGNVTLYNAEALRVLQDAARAASTDLIVDDLHAAVDGYCGVNYTSCDLQRPANVHFEPKGVLFLGQHVADSILKVLGI
eukprot:m.7999 g.7999  ORF g.7999 m.7999 type:complete len:271 (-) comp3087_c0_seq2:8-820(-)